MSAIDTLVTDLQKAVADAKSLVGAAPLTYTFSQVGSPLAPLVDATSWITHYTTVASTSIRDITDAWNGAAFDYATGTMHMVVPGGHTDSWINQSFACDVMTGTWRKTDGQTAFPPDQHVPGYAPTYDDAGTTQTLGTGYLADGKTPVTPHLNHAIVYFDGKPASRHTYGAPCWLPTQQRVFLISGSNWQSGAGDFFCGWFDPVAGVWTRKNNTPLSFDGISSVYDSLRDLIYWNRSGTEFVYAYNPATDGHTKIGAKAGDPLNADFGPQVQICCDGNFNYLYATIYKGWIARSPTLPATYANAIIRMKLGQTGLQGWEPVAVTGDTSIMYSMSPGMEYDPDLNAFVFWSWQFPGSLSILDLATFAITTVPIGGTPPTPTQVADSSSGVWGRFRRISKGRYCVMVSANAPMYQITAA